MTRKVVLISLLIVVVVAVIALVPLIVIARVMPSSYPSADVAGTQIAKFDDGVIRYQDFGSGDTAVLMLHGFGGNLVDWDPLWEQLDNCDCRRIRVDAPGFGQSTWETDDFDLESQAQRIIALLDELGVDKVIAVGTSMGGSLAATIAADYPDRVESVILMAPSGYTGSLTYPGLYGKMLKPGTLHDTATWISGTPLYSTLFPRSAARQALTVTGSYGPSWVDSLSKIRAPTLILWSRGDGTANDAAAEPVQQAIAGSSLILLDESTGHGVSKARPELGARSIELMLDGVAPKDVAAKLPAGTLRPGEVQTGG